MKKLFLLLALALPVMFFSCDDDDDNYSSSDMFGNWEFNKAEAKEVNTNNQAATDSIKKDILSQTKEDSYLFTFTEAGKFLKDSVEVGTFSVKNDKITLIDKAQEDTTVCRITKNTIYWEIDATERL